MTKITLFTNTGYNAVNGPLWGTPAAAAVAPGGTGEETIGPEVEIADANDPWHLDYVSVPAIYTMNSGLTEVDYCRLDVYYGPAIQNSYYYAVTDWRYTSSDVIQFRLLIDPHMSDARGRIVSYANARVTLPKGIVQRCNTPDVLACPAMIDELYKLTRPPVYHEDNIYGGTTAAVETIKLVALSVDPTPVITGDLVAQIAQITGAEGATTEKIQPGENINTPNPSVISFQLPYLKGAISQAGTRTYETQGYALYYIKRPGLRDAMTEVCNKLHALNMGGAVIGAYEVPSNMCEATSTGSTITSVVNLKGKVGLYTTPFTPRALYPDFPWAELMYSCGDFTYTLSSAASGDSISDAAINCDGHVHMFVDPRPDGRPYFILTRKNQVDTTNYQATIANLQSRAVAGATWNPIAISLNGASGSAFAELATTIAQQRIRDNLQTTERQIALGNFNQFMGGLGVEIGGLDKQALTGAGDVYSPLSMIGSGASYIGNMMATQYGQLGFSEQQSAWISPTARARQEAARASIDEALGYLSNYGYVAPTLKFQPQTSLQQAVGNGAVFTAQVPDYVDMARFGQIFAMFGRKCSFVVAGDVKLSPLEAASCVYVQMQPSDVGGGISKQLQLDRLKIGYRFWTKPGTKDFGAPGDYWEG